MPIYGGSLREAAGMFVHHLNSLLGKTITHTPMQALIVPRTVDGRRKEEAILAFPRRDGGRSYIELRTDYGTMEFYLGQTCDVVEDEDTKQLRLRTLSYGYGLRPLEMDDYLVRWEYVRFPSEGSRWCRHHVQGQITFDILDNRNEIQTVNLNDWHLPTGWVAIEEVIRFCLHDLGSRALSEPEKWHQALIESDEMFQR